MVAVLADQCTFAPHANFSGKEWPRCWWSSSPPPQGEHVAARLDGGGAGAHRRRPRGKDGRRGAVVAMVALVTTARPGTASGKGRRGRWLCTWTPRTTKRPSARGCGGASGSCVELRARVGRPQVVAAMPVALASVARPATILGEG